MKNRLALAHVLAAATNVRSRFYRPVDPHVRRSCVGVLHLHHRIGALGDRRPGHDSSGRAGSESDGRIGVGSDVGNHAQRDRRVDHIVGANRIPIHRTVIRAWNVEGRDDLLAQHAPMRIGERDLFRRHRRDFGEDTLLRFLDGDRCFPLSRALK